MGLLASLGRRGAAAALRGGGHLLVAVVPDNVTPWKLRKTASRTSANFLGWGLKQASKAIKSRKKRKAAEQKKKPKKRLQTAPPAAFLPWPTWPALKVAKASKPSTRTRPVAAPKSRPVSAISRTSTPPVLMVVRAKVPDEPRFNKNSWARGAGLSSSTDWDKPDRNRVSMRSRLKRAGARKKKPVSPRYNMGF